MSRANLALSALSLAAVAAVFLYEAGRTSPGPLSAAHADLPELAGGEACAACHGESGEPAKGCGGCHAPVVAQVRERTGFHGRLGPGEGPACARCHVEHRGDEAPLAGDRAFRLAGFPGGRGDYDHRGLDLRLGGRHLGLPCARCHPLADAARLPAGGRRFAGPRSSCAGCHPDPHEGAFGPDCGSCHGQEEPFERVAAFAHPEAFPLSGAHARPGCAACHPSGSARSVAGLLHSPLPARGCADCHEADYLSTREPDHARAGFPRACGDCHGTETFRGAKFSHWSFPLDGAHGRAACAACHEGGRYAGTPSDCMSCHAADYRGTRDPDHAALAYPEVCGTCHGTESFAGATFRHRFPIDRGKHRGMRCADCHESPRAPGTFTCVGCHDHGRREMDREHRRVPGYRYDTAACRRCHPDGEED